MQGLIVCPCTSKLLLATVALQVKRAGRWSYWCSGSRLVGHCDLEKISVTQKYNFAEPRTIDHCLLLELNSQQQAKRRHRVEGSQVKVVEQTSLWWVFFNHAVSRWSSSPVGCWTPTTADAGVVQSEVKSAFGLVFSRNSAVLCLVLCNRKEPPTLVSSLGWTTWVACTVSWNVCKLWFVYFLISLLFCEPCLCRYHFFFFSFFSFLFLSF